MSYARFSEGDVYVWQSWTGKFICDFCSLAGAAFVCDTRAEMLEHLQKHIDAGHSVPDRAITRLREEMDEVSSQDNS